MRFDGVENLPIATDDEIKRKQNKNIDMSNDDDYVVWILFFFGKVKTQRKVVSDFPGKIVLIFTPPLL